jgi:HPt (histidine-containing phosphotransfer) domain-containing protein
MSEAITRQQKIKALLAQLWLEKKDVTLGRIAVVEVASSALVSGFLAPELRTQALVEAHKLAGSLGTFGFQEGSRLSRTMEETLQEKRVLDISDGKRLVQLLHQLRCELGCASVKSPENKGMDRAQE